MTVARRCPSAAHATGAAGDAVDWTPLTYLVDPCSSPASPSCPLLYVVLGGFRTTGQIALQPGRAAPPVGARATTPTC